MPLDDYAALMPFIDEHEKGQAEFLGALLYDTLKPTSVVDWGCASGLYLVPFKNRGCEVSGIDAEPTAGHLLSDLEFWQYDIRHPVNFVRHDLALCIETAEHLHEVYSSPLVENVAKSADTVFWSAAHKGQGGQNHYNEQPASYWLFKFEARGFKLHPAYEKVNRAIAENPACQRVQWLIPNAMLLQRMP